MNAQSACPHRWLHSTHTQLNVEGWSRRMDKRCIGDAVEAMQVIWEAAPTVCLVFVLNSGRQVAVQTPPPTPPLLHNSNPNTRSPLQPLWRPLQPRPSSSSSCPSSFHPVYSPPNSFIHSSPNATSVLCFVMFSLYFSFFRTFGSVLSCF